MKLLFLEYFAQSVKFKSKYLGAWLSKREYYYWQNQVQFIVLDVNCVLKILDYLVREAVPLIYTIRE